MSTTHEPLIIGKGEHDIGLLPKRANRRGLIAGAHYGHFLSLVKRGIADDAIGHP